MQIIFFLKVACKKVVSKGKRGKNTFATFYKKSQIIVDDGIFYLCDFKVEVHPERPIKSTVSVTKKGHSMQDLINSYIMH